MGAERCWLSGGGDRWTMPSISLSGGVAALVLTLLPSASVRGNCKGEVDSGGYRWQPKMSVQQIISSIAMLDFSAPGMLVGPVPCWVIDIMPMGSVLLSSPT